MEDIIEWLSLKDNGDSRLHAPKDDISFSREANNNGDIPETMRGVIACFAMSALWVGVSASTDTALYPAACTRHRRR
jgi:hypothetical protein